MGNLVRFFGCCNRNFNKKVKVFMRNFYLLVLFIGVAFLLSCSKVQVEGLPTPDFTLERFDKGSLSLSEFKGRPVVLYWFASW